jgi:hypothetical protein
MIWWRWDDDGRCWRPTLVRPDAAWRLGNGATLIPLSGSRRWALLARNGARVNGLPCLPCAVLNHQDEVRISGERYCFSGQTPVEVVTFGDGHKKIRCARCLGRLGDGDRIVRCPRCRAHHHAGCWTYDARCPRCSSPTDDTIWVPDPLN